MTDEQREAIISDNSLDTIHAVARAIESAAVAPLLERIAALNEELETERIRLAACGVVAMSDTPESAKRQRQMLPKYMSASCGDVMRRVDECMELRTKVAALEAKLAQRVPDGYTALLKAAQDVLSWTEASHRPPVRDVLECGRGASVRIHALADLHDAVQALSAAPAAPEQQSEPVPGVFVAGLGHQTGCTSHKSANAPCNCGYTGSAFVTVAQAPNAQQAEPYGNPMSERAAKLAADPVRGPRIAELRERLAQQAEVQEPFAFAYEYIHGKTLLTLERQEDWADNEIQLFTRPQPAQLQALSATDVMSAWVATGGLVLPPEAMDFARSVQSALAAKNGAVLAVIKAKE